MKVEDTQSSSLCPIVSYIERTTITLYPVGRPVRATITLYPIGRPIRATITLYPIWRPVRAIITLYPIELRKFVSIIKYNCLILILQKLLKK